VGKIETVEIKGRYMLACYGRDGWVVFSLNASGTVDKNVINGKWSDVWQRWQELTSRP
jgi:hypothetical protein